jgi:D-alanine-D-alanine ligase
MNKKIRVGILFGGKSAEHEVSLQSAKNVAYAIDKDKYEVFLIGIDKSGQWFLPNQSHFLSGEGRSKVIKLTNKNRQNITFIPEGGGVLKNVKKKEFPQITIDIVFPILHGPFGEDGTVQGLLKLANIPFVGASVLGSAIGMDKDVMKRLLRDADIPVAKFLVFKKGEKIDFFEVKKELGIPLFVKPANLGSSVGVSKVKNKQEFEKAITDAFQYDTKILIEETIVGREIECSVLGNQDPIASVPGEILPNHEFYSYEAKYRDENGAVLKIPAIISEKEKKNVQELAIKTFKILECEGLGRVDFFLKENGKLVVIEINTIPGFTKISMYPRLWEASGISYTELIDRLLQLAVQRFEEEKKIKTSFV